MFVCVCFSKNVAVCEMLPNEDWGSYLMLTPIPCIIEICTNLGEKGLSNHLVFNQDSRNFLKIDHNVIYPLDFCYALSFCLIQIIFNNFKHIANCNHGQVRKIGEFNLDQECQVNISFLMI